VAPILSIGSASLVAISTLTSEINFYTRLVRHGEAVCAHMRDLTGAPTQIKMVDPDTDRPLFQTRCIELACEACIADGKGHECVHRLHLVPQWQSAERHRKLRVMMQDRPDLIQRYAKHMVFIHVSLLCLDSYIKKLATRSELAGLAFDSLQQVFRKGDIKIALSISPLAFVRPPNGVSHHRPGERPNTDLSSGRYKTRLVFPRLVLRQKGARKCGLNSCVRHCAQAAGGPQSDYAVVSLVRERGTVTVRSRLGWEWVCLCQNCCHVCASGEWFITLERPRTFADARGGLRF
jgi:hypothetical protein